MIALGVAGILAEAPGDSQVFSMFFSRLRGFRALRHQAPGAQFPERACVADAQQAALRPIDAADASLGPFQRNCLPLGESLCQWIPQVDPRQSGQQALQRQHQPVSLRGRRQLQLVEGRGIGDQESTRLRTPQGGQVSPATQRGAQVFHQGADVSALAAADPQVKAVVLEAQ